MSTIHSTIGTPCKRCNKEPTVVFSRNDSFCRNCFIRFIRGKQRKQMQDEKFKVKFNDKQKQPKVLLGLKNDSSSYVLFDIIISLLLEQINMGPRARLGFKLIVCLIDEEFRLHEIKQFYTPELLNKLQISFLRINLDSFTDGSIGELTLTPTFETYSHATSSAYSFNSLLSQIQDKSTKEDLSNIVEHELFLRASIKTNSSVILLPSSMTTLAVDVIADTVRGRGTEIPDKLEDGTYKVYNTELEIINPLRDVLTSEINVYASISNLDQFLLTTETTFKSAKNKTVDELVTEYFESIELNYPEVVSTVVKIGSKLSNPIKQMSFATCKICSNPIYHDPKSWLEQITVKDHAQILAEEDKINLQRYLDSQLESQQTTLPETSDCGEQVQLCYGCLITLNSAHISTFCWPSRPTKEDILNEYILTDDES